MISRTASEGAERAVAERAHSPSSATIIFFVFWLPLLALTFVFWGPVFAFGAWCAARDAQDRQEWIER